MNGDAVDNAIRPIIDNIIDPIILLMFAVGVVVFVYGVFQLVLKADDSDARTRGKWSIIGGLIGMFIMVSAWGIINFVSSTLHSV